MIGNTKMLVRHSVLLRTQFPNCMTKAIKKIIYEEYICYYIPSIDIHSSSMG